MPRDLESGRSETKIKNDYPAIFTHYRSNRGAGFFWFLLSRLGRLHWDRALCRRLPLQSALGNGRSRADPARTRLAGACAKSKSNNRDSERAETATRLTQKERSLDTDLKAWPALRVRCSTDVTDGKRDSKPRITWLRFAAVRRELIDVEDCRSTLLPCVR